MKSKTEAARKWAQTRRKFGKPTFTFWRENFLDEKEMKSGKSIQCSHKLPLQSPVLILWTIAFSVSFMGMENRYQQCRASISAFSRNLDNSKRCKKEKRWKSPLVYRHITGMNRPNPCHFVFFFLFFCSAWLSLYKLVQLSGNFMLLLYKSFVHRRAGKTEFNHKSFQANLAMKRFLSPGASHKVYNTSRETILCSARSEICMKAEILWGGKKISIAMR